MQFEIEHIRSKAGTRISDGSRENEGISNWHRDQANNEGHDLARLAELKNRSRKQ
jgi:hypothetical protein